MNPKNQIQSQMSEIPYSIMNGRLMESLNHYRLEIVKVGPINRNMREMEQILQEKSGFILEKMWEAIYEG